MANVHIIFQNIVMSSIFAVVITKAAEGQCPPGRGGQLCRLQCPVRCETCTSADICQQCQGNYQPPSCRKCKKGFFGVNCEDECSGCHDCDATTGACPMCAEPGLARPDCTSQCPNGTYGMHCTNRCPLVCAAACDSKTGDCLQCDHGYGKYCTLDCSKPANSEACGLYCKATCEGMCNTTTTQCDLCASGLKTPFCNETCTEGFHGQNCRDSCPVGCKDALCDPVEGTCGDCQPGLTGPTCSQRRTCEAGFYGEKCSMPCPQTCADNVCYQYKGICLKCHPGYEGDMCDEPCSNGTYGQNCSRQCSKNCAGVCSVTSGHCSQCVSGYQGDMCDVTCVNGTWGAGCVNSCAEFCADAKCDPVTGHCDTCVGERSGNFCTDVLMEVKNSEDADYPVDIRAFYIFLGLLVPVVVVSCPVAIYQIKVKRLFRKTKEKEYRDKTIEKLIDIPSSELEQPPSRAVPELQVNRDKLFAMNETGFFMKSADLSLESFTKSSMSKPSNMSKFNSNFEVTTRWTKSKAPKSEDASKGTKSNSLAIDISLNERESQKSIADAHSFLEDDRSHTSKFETMSAYNAIDVSTVKTFKNLVHFEQGRDPMSTSTSASQSLSMSGSYPRSDPRSELALPRKTSTNIKMITTQHSTNPSESTDLETSLTHREKLWSIHESKTPDKDYTRKQRTPIIDTSHKYATGQMKGVTFSKSNIEKKQSLTVVNLWKAKDHSIPKSNGKSRSFTSQNDTKPLTTFLSKERVTESLGIRPSISREAVEFYDHRSLINLVSTSQTRNDYTEKHQKPEVSCKTLPYFDDDLSSLSNLQPVHNFVRSSQKTREKPLIQKIFDNVLDAMQSGSNLYQNRKMEMNTEYDTTAEDQSSLEDQTDRSGDSRSLKSDKVVELPDRNTCVPAPNSRDHIPEHDVSKPIVHTTKQYLIKPLKKNPPEEIHPEKVHNVLGTSELKAHNTNIDKMKATSLDERHSIGPRKSSRPGKGINLHVGTSPTGSIIDDDSIEHSTRPCPNLRLSPPSKLFKIIHSPGSTNISQVSLGSESLSHISDDHLQTPPKIHYFSNFLKTDKNVLREGSPPAPTFNNTHATSEMMVTGRSPVKSQPKDVEHSLGVATSSAGSKSCSKSFPAPTFSNPMESSTIAGVAGRSSQCVPWFRSASSVFRPGSSMANIHRTSWINTSDIANQEARTKGTAPINSSITTNTPTSIAHTPKSTNVIRCPTTREISPMSYSRSFQNIPETKSTPNSSPTTESIVNSPESQHTHKVPIASLPQPSAESATAGPLADAVRLMLQMQNKEAITLKNNTKHSESDKETLNYYSVYPEFQHTRTKMDSSTPEPAHHGSVTPRLNEFTNVARKTKPDTPRPSGSDHTPESDTDTMVSSWKSISQTDKTVKPK